MKRNNETFSPNIKIKGKEFINFLIIVQVSMELEEDDDEEDFHAMSPEYDDSEMFTNDDHHARRKQTPLSKS